MNLILRAWLHARRLWVLWQIEDTETYIYQCGRNDLTGSLNLQAYRDQLGELRVKLIDIESRLEKT